MTSHLRPDEMARESEIKKAQGRTKEIRSGIESLGSLASYGLATKTASKILPFLSEYIPEDLAFKGINKVMPGLGDFLKKGMKQGLSLQSGLDFLKKEIVEEQEKKEPAKDNRNIIEQYSPELFQFLTGEIQGGRQPIEAAAIAQHNPKFSDIIKKLSKDHKTNWSNIIASIFGTGQTAQPEQQKEQPMQQGQGGGLDPGVMQIIQQGQAILQKALGKP